MEIITRSAAKAAGLRHYFTGTPCNHGHVAARFVSTWGCVECSRIKALRYAATHREAARIRARNWSRANKDQKKATLARYRADGRLALTKRREYVKHRADYLRRAKECAARKLADNPELFRAQNAERAQWREAAKRNATPSWADRERIAELYDDASLFSSAFRDHIAGRPLTFDVDHTIPLRGKKVRGLHTVENLTVMEHLLNVSKGNRYPWSPPAPVFASVTVELDEFGEHFM
jgi:hypothetical protein